MRLSVRGSQVWFRKKELRRKERKRFFANLREFKPFCAIFGFPAHFPHFSPFSLEFSGILVNFPVCHAFQPFSGILGFFRELTVFQGLRWETGQSGGCVWSGL